MRWLWLFLFPWTLCAQMTLEEKVGQILMVHFHGEEVNDEARFLIEKLHVGGIIYYNWANGLTSFEQVKQLSEGLQKHATTPLLIAVDQEGGVVTRLKNGFTPLPTPREVGQGKVKAAKQLAKKSGQEMKRAGITLNLAPVADIATNPSAPLYSRSYGSDPKTVAAFVAAVVEGYSEAGILATLKHFPGIGGVTLDTHEGLPTLHKSSEELERWELVPFHVKAPLIMPGHILVPAIDPIYPATFSTALLNNTLRHDLHFEGVVISDSLVMEGALQGRTIEEVALLAFNAGCDILLLGGKLLSLENRELTSKEIASVHATLCQAVRDGRITQTKLDTSVSRILKLKNR